MYISHKGLVSRIKDSHNSKTTKIQLKNRQRTWTDKSKDVQMAYKHMKRNSASVIIKEMRIKTIRYHLTPTRMAIIKKKKNNKHWYRCRETGPSYALCKNVKWWNINGECKMDLLYTTVNHIQYPVINHNGKENEKEHIYHVYITESLCCITEIDITL